MIALATVVCACAVALPDPPSMTVAPEVRHQQRSPGAPGTAVVVGGAERDALWVRKPDAIRRIDGVMVVEGARTVLWAPTEPGRGDFTATLELMMPELSASGAGVRIDSSVFGIDGPGGELYTSGPLFMGGTTAISGSAGTVRAGVPFEVKLVRAGAWLDCLVNGESVTRVQLGTSPVGRIGIWAGRSAIAVGSFALECAGPRVTPPEVLWSSGAGAWDEVSSPAIAALPDGTLVVTGSGVRSDEPGKDVRNMLVRVRGASGSWSESRTIGPADLGGSDAVLIADTGAVHMLVQAGAVLKSMQSADAGLTWSAPTDVLMPSPLSRLAGHGLRIRAGDGALLCVPVTVPLEGGGRSVALMRSADRGVTWVAGAPVVEPSDAPTLVDLGSGRIAMIGVRPQVEGRWMWTSDDAGATWGAPLACAGLDRGTTRACAWRGPDGSLMCVGSAGRASSALRRWRSDDGGGTWIEQLPVQGTPAGACAVAVAPDGSVWLAHEGGDFARREHVLVRPLR